MLFHVSIKIFACSLDDGDTCSFYSLNSTRTLVTDSDTLSYVSVDSVETITHEAEECKDNLNVTVTVTDEVDQENVVTSLLPDSASLSDLRYTRPHHLAGSCDSTHVSTESLVR